MPGRLTDMRIDKVSLVDNGANGKRFAVLKQRSPMVSDPLAKTEDTDAQAEAKSLVERLTALLMPSQSDEDNTDAEEAVTKVVSDYIDLNKAGRKISGSRLARMKEAATALAAIIEEASPAEPVKEDTAIGVAKENDEMTPEEVQKAINDALTAAVAEGGAIAKMLADAIKPNEAAPVEKQDVPTEAQTELAKVLGEVKETQGQVIEAVAKLVERVEGIEKGRRQSADINEAGEKVEKKSVFAGIL